MATEVGSAWVIDVRNYSWSLNIISSVFISELFAILKALEHKIDSAERKFLVCSDSRNSLDAIFKLDTDILPIHTVHICAEIRKTVVFLWTPGSSGIKYNEIADKAAKNAALINNPDENVLPLEWRAYPRTEALLQ